MSLRWWFMPEGERVGDVCEPAPDWAGLVRRILNRDPWAMEELRVQFGPGLKLFLDRELGGAAVPYDADSILQTVIERVQDGELRYPEHLLDLVRTLLVCHISLRRDLLASRPAGIEAAAPATTELQPLSTPSRPAARQGSNEEELCAELGLAVADVNLLKEQVRDKFFNAWRNQARRAEAGGGTKYLKESGGLG